MTHLRKEARYVRHEVCAVRPKEAGGGERADTPPALIDVDSMEVVCVEDGGADEATEQLADDVAGDLVPGEASPGGEGDGDLG